MPSKQSAVLAGIRVLDFTSMIAGAYCTRLLADLGAEVIKCEPLSGDYVRVPAPLRDGKSAYFAHLNCGKKSLCLDLKRPEARELVAGLAAQSDVVVENFRPGVMQRLGLDYETLAELKPDIVYCAITGYGQSGPDAGLPAYAPIVHAASGYDLANMEHQDNLERPLRTGLYVADYFSGMTAAGGIQGALLHRERTGQGQAVDVALMDNMLSMLVYQVLQEQFSFDGPLMLYAPSPTRDGYVIVMPLTQANFVALAEVTDHPEWLNDPRFADFAERQRNWDELMLLIDQWTATRSSEECEALISEAGCPISRYKTVGQAITSAQSRYRGVMAEVDDGAGPVQVVNAPWRLSHSPVAAQPWVSEVGQHTRELLCDLLGYSPQRVTELAQQGVLIAADE
ncbi:MAG: CoA transferase [Alphaproteobacteria bacterium]|nr:CoA transferase [Alphaproteobacteria bacterium]MDP6622201.1 CoA transferase [Alphaproteobacteria bacterium]